MSVVLKATTVLAMMLAGLTLTSPAHAVDRPGTMKGATTNSPLNTVLSDTVGSATDQDFFRFRTTTSGYARVLLTDLPANYRIRVYTSNGTLLTGSARPGRAFEEVYRHFPAGTYFVRISSEDGTFSAATPYRLKFQPLAEGLKILSQRENQYFRCGGRTTDGGSARSAGYFVIEGEVLNNSTRSYAGLQVRARYYDGGGALVFTKSEPITAPILGNRRRAPFIVDVAVDVPDSAVRYTLSLSGTSTTTPPVAGLVLTPGEPFSEECSSGWPGQVRNDSGGAVKGVRVALATYRPDGTVARVSDDLSDPADLASGGTGSYVVAPPNGHHYQLYVSAARP